MGILDKVSLVYVVWMDGVTDVLMSTDCLQTRTFA